MVAQCTTTKALLWVAKRHEAVALKQLLSASLYNVHEAVFKLEVTQECDGEFLIYFFSFSNNTSLRVFCFHSDEN